MNYCSRCGTPVAPTDNFCGSCAAPIPRGAAPEPEAAAAGYQAQANPLAATLQPDQNRPPQASAPAIVHGAQPPAPSPYAAPPAPAPVPGMPAPPFGAPPPGMDAGFGYTPQPAFGAPAPAAPQPAFGAPAPVAPQPAFGGPQPATPYGPAPAPQGAPVARCDLGHDIPPGSSYCDYGHPIALGEMRIAGGDAFSAPTAYPQDGGLPPTGPMSPFPQPPQQPPAPQPPAYGAPVQPAFGAGPSQPPPAGQWPAQPPMQPPTPQPAAAAAPQEGAARVLRGFLYSFHSEQAGVFWPLYLGRNTIGRAGAGESLEIEIPDATTSSRHATFVCDPTSVVIEDEGSTNGTFVNDQPLGFRGKTELRDGDRVRFGAYNAAIRLVTR